jgi:hypothetical protein
MLVPCSECRRHVRDDEACPFCGGLPGEVIERSLSPRIARAAVILGMVSLSACYGAPDSIEDECRPDARVCPDTGVSDSADGG